MGATITAALLKLLKGLAYGIVSAWLAKHGISIDGSGVDPTALAVGVNTGIAHGLHSVIAGLIAKLKASKSDAPTGKK